ncbi:MAG: ISAzo13 family transposase [Actinobacteria bacterium]|nr:ISAzo13 family transposase [Actinomycetota bacterium]
MIDEEAIGERYRALAGEFDERRRRLWAAAEARSHGRGGVAAVARATGMSATTIYKGLGELESGETLERGRVRRPGGGRKPLSEQDPALLGDLERLVSEDDRGDPESPLRWTAKSVRNLADALRELGHQAHFTTVAKLLRELGYSLQANAKTREGASHPDRDAQFRHISQTVKAALDADQPAISVDAKKRELVGDFKAVGRELAPKGRPVEVRTHDFKDKQLGHAIPYGILDLTRDEGWVNVGIDANTAQFAAASIQGWWEHLGRERYPQATTLTITADCGGSNGNRLRLWKAELQRLADDTGLRIQVCHFPPGTSKWNKIEHRLFSFISQNWRGKPLISHEVIINLIAATSTRTGLKVYARLDKRPYPKKLAITDEQLAAVNLEGDEFHPEWNYRIAGINRRGERNERVRH